MDLGICWLPTQSRKRRRQFQPQQSALMKLALNAGNTIIGTRSFGLLSTATRIKSISTIIPNSIYPLRAGMEHLRLIF